jgi:arginyl-tRNA synthetase
MIRRILEDNLTEALKKTGHKDIEPDVLPTTDQKFGDYYSTIALKLAKAGSQQKPLNAAKSLVASLPKNEEVFAAEIAPNGFINFKISPKYAQSQVQKIIESDSDFGKANIGRGKKIQVEFISANPTGPLTLGNGRGGFTGDVLANCLEKAGYQVEREYYINDTGNQIRALGLSILNELGVETGSRESLYKGEYINQVAKKVKAAVNIEKYKEKPEKVGEIAADLITTEHIKPTLGKIKISFDKFVSEKGLHEDKKLDLALDILKKKGLVSEKEGAIWFVPKQKNNISIEDKDRVLVRSEREGERSPTYFLADIAYHLNKFDRGFNKVINIWGADHAGYIPRMKLAASELGFADKLEIIIVQLVRLVENGKEVKISKRAGTFVTLEELVDQIGLDIARFFFISRSPSTHLDFELGLAREISNRNPVYYVQYAHARCNSIIKKAHKEGYRTEDISKINSSLINEPVEEALIKHLLRLPELVEDISQNYSTHLLANYVVEIADKFHRFYEQVRVIGPDEKTSIVRLALVSAVKITLCNSLQLMGISAPEYMEKVEGENESKAS